MIFFLIFLLRTVHFGKVPDKLALAYMVGAATLGGSSARRSGPASSPRAAGDRLRHARPDHGCHRHLRGAIRAVGSAGRRADGRAGQALVKLAQDSIVQREIGEDVRSSTFAASETLHQLSWVARARPGC